MKEMQCDHGHDALEVRRLDTGGGSGLFLCSTHWKTEMSWRMERNIELEQQNQFDIIPWSTIETS